MSLIGKIKWKDRKLTRHVWLEGCAPYCRGRNYTIEGTTIYECGLAVGNVETSETKCGIYHIRNSSYFRDNGSRFLKGMEQDWYDTIFFELHEDEFETEADKLNRLGAFCFVVDYAIDESTWDTPLIWAFLAGVLNLLLELFIIGPWWACFLVPFAAVLVCCLVVNTIRGIVKVETIKKENDC